MKFCHEIPAPLGWKGELAGNLTRNQGWTIGEYDQRKGSVPASVGSQDG